jgi:hypothetical protein
MSLIIYGVQKKTVRDDERRFRFFLSFLDKHSLAKQHRDSSVNKRQHSDSSVTSSSSNNYHRKKASKHQSSCKSLRSNKKQQPVR